MLGRIGAALYKCSVHKLLLKNSQNSPPIDSVGATLIMLEALNLQLYEKEILALVFSLECYGDLRNSFFAEHLWVTASRRTNLKIFNWNSSGKNFRQLCRLLVLVVSFTTYVYINPFFPNAPFLYTLKTSENLMVFWYFQGLEKGCIENKWVKTWTNVAMKKQNARIFQVKLQKRRVGIFDRNLLN